MLYGTGVFLTVTQHVCLCYGAVKEDEIGAFGVLNDSHLAGTRHIAAL